MCARGPTLRSSRPAVCPVWTICGSSPRCPPTVWKAPSWARRSTRAHSLSRKPLPRCVDRYRDPMRVTVLGMGNMGRAFASRALDRGHHVTVWNRTAGKASDLVTRGATEISSVPDAVARADATLVVLADDDAVLDVCVGIDGAMASVANGSVLANISTVAPDTARELAAAGPADAVLDAPV